MRSWSAAGRIILDRYLAEDFSILLRWPRQVRDARGQRHLLH